MIESTLLHALRALNTQSCPKRDVREGFYLHVSYQLALERLRY